MLTRGQSAKPLTGFALHMGAITVLVCMSACIKLATEAVPPGQAVFARALFSLPLILGWIALQGPLRDGLRIVRPRLHLMRGLVGTTALSLNVLALSRLPLPEVTAIDFAAPLMTVVFAVIILGEKVGPVRWSAVLIGFFGVLIVIWPRLGLDGSALGSDWARIKALALRQIEPLTLTRAMAAKKAKIATWWQPP